jgi:hypothetical protein
MSSVKNNKRYLSFNEAETPVKDAVDLSFVLLRPKNKKYWYYS